MAELLDTVKTKARSWLDSPVIDDETKQSIRALLEATEPSELIDHFYKDLEFGTGGLRGIMGVGSNCMNRYTVGIATQGLCDYLHKALQKKFISVAIAHDSRNNSRYFAEVAAGVFAANGIEVHLFPMLRPTPLLSFAIRHLHCDSGIVVTASHNPKEYNGYKVYWDDGAQVVPPHDKGIIAEVSAITSFEHVKFDGDTSLIKSIGPEVENAYYENVINVLPDRQAVKRRHDIPIVYTSLHGAGITMVPECLKRIGFTNVHVVEEQRDADGNFPTVTSPNPEETAAMKMAMDLGDKVGASLVMATDPDTDRVGIGIRHPDGHIMLLNGNQAFAMMMSFILNNLADKKSSYIAKTIVTTELVDEMAQRANVECYNTLTGFKYIASLIGKNEGKKQFIAAGEESYGYLVGDFVRDKDAVSACAFFAVMNACAADAKKTLYEWLLDMYLDNSFYKEHLVNLTRKGQQGEQEIRQMMEKFRTAPSKTIAGQKVIRTRDYLSLVEKDLSSGKESTLDFPKSDVLQFYLEDGTKISIRPSGTEPKIKFYISVRTKLKSKELYEETEKMLEDRIKAVVNGMGIS